MKHGEGVYKWPDGRCYYGKWFFGKKEGNGKYVATDGTEVAENNSATMKESWPEENYQGTFKKIYLDGSVYTGDFIG